MPFIKISKCLNCDIAHEWLFDAPTLKELRSIKKLTGMNGNDFMDASDSGDPEALAALIYILHVRDGIKIPFDDVDLDFATLDIQPTEDEKEAEAKAVAAMQAETENPTSPENGQTEKAELERK